MILNSHHDGPDSREVDDKAACTAELIAEIRVAHSAWAYAALPPEFARRLRT